MEVIIHPHCLWMFGVVDRLTLKVIPACEPARCSDLKQYPTPGPYIQSLHITECRAVHCADSNVSA